MVQGRQGPGVRGRGGVPPLPLLLTAVLMLTSADDADDRGTASTQRIVLFENFESLSPHLVPSDNSTVYDEGSLAWSPLPPFGWRVDNSGLTLGGCTPFEGWTPWDLDIYQAPGQGRELFTLGSGVALVADGAQYSQCGSNSLSSSLSSSITSPVMDISGFLPGTIWLHFDSSLSTWGATPALTIRVHYDGGGGGPAVQELNLTHPEASNQRLQVQLDNPASATRMAVGWAVEAGGAASEWWWILDNVLVTGNVDAPPPPQACAARHAVQRDCASPGACLTGRVKQRMVARLRRAG